MTIELERWVYIFCVRIHCVALSDLCYALSRFAADIRQGLPSRVLRCTCNNDAMNYQSFPVDTHRFTSLFGELMSRWAICGGTVPFLLSDVAQVDCLHDEGPDRRLARYYVQLPGINEAQFRPLTPFKQRHVRLSYLQVRVFDGITCVYDTFMPCYWTAVDWQLSMP